MVGSAVPARGVSAPDQPLPSSRGATATGLLSIGQVLARFQSEFPDLTPSKLRFLEEQELIFPVRSTSGYRKYSVADIERLSTVLTLQRDYYLPLRVIRAQLAEADSVQVQVPTPVPMSASASIPVGPATLTAAAVSEPSRRLNRADLLSAGGASAELLDAAIAVSLIVAAEFYDHEALVMLRALVGLEASGLEPRHLSIIKHSVEREADVVAGAIRSAPHSRSSSQNQDAARERALELVTHLSALHSAVLRAQVRKLLR